MHRFLHSIRLRLTLWYAGVLAVALLLFALSVYIFVVRTLQSSIDTALGSYGQQAVGRQVQGRLNARTVRASPVFHSEPLAALLVMDIHGKKKKLVKSDAPSPSYQELRIALQSGRESCGTFQVVVPRNAKSPPRSPERYCIKLVYHHGRAVGGVEVLQSLAGVDQALDRLRLALLLGIPFALLLAGAGGWVLAGRALEPVDSITQMARSITATDLSRRINLSRQDELGRLAGTFDDMIERLERAFQEQRQLTADVSHELRSPLTVLEAQTTLSLKRARTPEEYQQVLISVQEEVERMSGMVKHLLMLARADAGQEEMLFQPVLLGAIAEPIVDGMQALVHEKGVSLSLRADRGVLVHGNAGRLRQMLLNLLDNAVRHTPAGGRVEVTVGTESAMALLTVTDSGEGIEIQDLPHIFHRFYRGDRARQRGTGNSGLGLSIVKWIVEAHGGDIEVRSESGRGSAFRVSLPLAVPELVEAGGV